MFYRFILTQRILASDRTIAINIQRHNPIKPRRASIVKVNFHVDDVDLINKCFPLARKKKDLRFLLISGMARKKLKIKIKLKFSAILWMNSRKYIFSGSGRRSLINFSIKEDNTIERVEVISAGFEASSPAGDGRRGGEHPRKNAKLDYRRFHSVRDVMSLKIFLYLS